MLETINIYLWRMASLRPNLSEFFESARHPDALFLLVRSKFLPRIHVCSSRTEPDISFAYLLIAGTYYLAVKYSLTCTPSVITLLACVAWRFSLGALSNKGGRGQRNREEIGAEATFYFSRGFAARSRALRARISLLRRSPLLRPARQNRHATQAITLLLPTDRHTLTELP